MSIEFLLAVCHISSLRPVVKSRKLINWWGVVAKRQRSWSFVIKYHIVTQLTLIQSNDDENRVACNWKSLVHFGDLIFANWWCHSNGTEEKNIVNCERESSPIITHCTSSALWLTNSIQKNFFADAAGFLLTHSDYQFGRLVLQIFPYYTFISNLAMWQETYFLIIWLALMTN